MIIKRIWAMPNKWTFSIKPIRELISDEVGNGLLKKGLWCDPFAGMLSPADVTNDLNPEMKTDFHLDALEFLKLQKTDKYDGIFYDPPYSLRQASECYKSFGKELLSGTVTNALYWSSCKDEISRMINPGGKVICFGWNTMGLGIDRGFDMTRVLIVPHGGSKNDTLVTVEIKM